MSCRYRSFHKPMSKCSIVLTVFQPCCENLDLLFFITCTDDSTARFYLQTSQPLLAFNILDFSDFSPEYFIFHETIRFTASLQRTKQFIQHSFFKHQELQMNISLEWSKYGLNPGDRVKYERRLSSSNSSRANVKNDKFSSS